MKPSLNSTIRSISPGWSGLEVFKGVSNDASDKVSRLEPKSLTMLISIVSKLLAEGNTVGEEAKQKLEIKSEDSKRDCDYLLRRLKGEYVPTTCYRATRTQTIVPRGRSLGARFDLAPRERAFPLSCGKVRKTTSEKNVRRGYLTRKELVNVDLEIGWEDRTGGEA